MTVQFGVFVPQGWRMDLVGITDPVEAYETMTRVGQRAEELGYASIWLFDHFHTVPFPTQEPTFECWTSTAALARDTKTIRIGQMVTCNSYRNPALLAKMASTVDVLSHGRLDFGIGAGWNENEYLAYGYEYPSAPVRLKQLEEALQVILAMWTQEEAQFAGTFYQVQGAINQPKGVQKPHIPIWIGGAGEKVTLKLVAKYGNATNLNNLTTTEITGKFAALKQHCENVGRDYESIRRTAFYTVAIAETDEEALQKAQPYVRRFGDEIHQRMLVGSPQTIKRRIQELEALGVQEIILFFDDSTQLTSLEFFAHHFIQ